MMENSFTVILPNLADTITHIKLMGDYIRDRNGNIMADSVRGDRVLMAWVSQRVTHTWDAILFRYVARPSHASTPRRVADYFSC